MQTYIIIGIAVAAVFIVLILFAKTRNRFVVLRNRVRDQESQIDVQLKRRYDLIPNLIATVRGQADFEKSALEAVVQARTKATQTGSFSETVAANDALTGALHRMFAVAESYPDLKSNAGFLKLQEELSDTENKIAYARQFYNDSVLNYNNAVEMFPSSIVAGMSGFPVKPFLSAGEHERENVKISAGDF